MKQLSLDSAVMMGPPSVNRPKRTPAGLTRDAGCRACRLHETADYVCLLGAGDRPSEAMIIGEAPGEREDDSGTPFVGRSGQLLEQIMVEAGLERDDVYITNAVHCRPPDNRTPTKAEVRNCKPWLSYEIAQIKPKVVLLLGNVALESVLGLKGIKKLRGQPIVKDGVTYLPTYHPAYVLRDERARPQLRSDLMKFRALIDGGGIQRIPGLDYCIVETEENVQEMMDHLRSIPEIVYDLETTSLYPWHGEITSINIGDDKRQWCIPVSAEAWPVPWEEEDVELMLLAIDTIIHGKSDQKPRKRLKLLCNHNGKFDALWMKQHFGLDWAVDFDTMLAHYILDENSFHGLDVVSSDKFGAIDWDIPLSVKNGKSGTLEQHAQYAALDILYTFMLWQMFKRQLEEEPATSKVFYKLLMPAATLFVEIEYHGVTINRAHFGKVEKQLRATMHDQELKLNKHFPGINWRSTQQVADVLFNKLGLEPLDLTAKGAPSTSESVLKRLADQHPIPALLMKHREAKQQLSFFIEGWKPWLVKHGNRWVLHPSFKFLTTTGRLSCVDPNLQQVPRDPLIRQLVTAKLGWILVEADLSQIELRILAELSGDPEMMRCFQTGIDIHWLTCMREIFRGGGYHDEVIETAIAITRRNDIDYDDCLDILLKAGPDLAAEKGPKPRDGWPGWKEIRKRAKAINFGYAYGMWWKKFILYARDNYDIVVTEKEAQASRVSYFDLYTKLNNYHNKQRGFAHRHGYVKSLIGRKRRLPRAMDREDSFERGEAERQAINAPVQGFASDLNLMAALALRDMHGPEYCRIVGTVHDSLLVEVRIDKAKTVVQDILKIMQHPPLLDVFDVEMRVPLEAEAKLGPWGLGVSPEKYFR